MAAEGQRMGISGLTRLWTRHLFSAGILGPLPQSKFCSVFRSLVLWRLRSSGPMCYPVTSITSQWKRVTFSLERTQSYWELNLEKSEPPVPRVYLIKSCPLILKMTTSESSHLMSQCLHSCEVSSYHTLGEKPIQDPIAQGWEYRDHSKILPSAILLFSLGNSSPLWFLKHKMKLEG